MPSTSATASSSQQQHKSIIHHGHQAVEDGPGLQGQHFRARQHCCRQVRLTLQAQLRVHLPLLTSCRYWGKRDSKLNLPTNSSLSVTLSQADLKTHTTASCSASFTSPDTLLLNHYPQDISNPRTQACLKSLRALRKDLVEAKDSNAPKLSEFPLRIVSENNFPTAAGLASSAAGFAALVRAIADLYQLPSSPEELSRIARQGSGSACRSLFGGYVAWQAGKAADGSDSLAVPVQPTSHWPGMRAIILVASAKKKDVSSTAGMQATVATSTLFSARVDKVVPERMSKMTEAITKRDFQTFGELTMRDSNSFHATCADTWPPIFYMNDTSRAAVRLVEAINEAKGSTVCAYTFDAGPNAVVFYEDKNAEFVEKAFRKVLGHVSGWKASVGNAAPSEALPTPKKETPQWLSKFSEALTIDAPNHERDPPQVEEPTTTAKPDTTDSTSSQAPAEAPRHDIPAPDWLRLAATSLTSNTEHTTSDISTAANTAANAASSSATTTAKATPAWLNKFAEALTTDAPSMREEGDDSSAGAGAEGLPVSESNNNAAVGSKPAATSTPGWLNKFAAALTTGSGTAAPAPEEESEVEETQTQDAKVNGEAPSTVNGDKRASESVKEAKPAPAKPIPAGTTTAAAAPSEPKQQPQQEEPKTQGQVVYDERVVAALKEGVSRVIMTGVGEGPRSTRDHLIDEDGGVENRYSF